MEKELLEKLAAELGGTVQASKHNPDCNYLIYRGLKFSIGKPPGFTSKKQTQHHISVYEPDIHRDATSFHSKEEWNKLTHSINVSIDKSIAQIAKAINSRFDIQGLVNVKTMFDADAAMHNQSKIDHKTLVDKLVKITGREASYGDDGLSSKISLYTKDGYYGDIKIQFQSVEFSIRAVKDFELMSKIAELLKV